MGVCIGGGFQSKTDKPGFIDMQAVFADSNLKRKNDDHLQLVEQARLSTLEFLGLNPSMNADQLARYKVLSTKETLTPAETAELAKIKQDAQAESKKYDDLRQKQNPSQQDVATLNDLGARNTLDTSARSQWGREFDLELRTMQANLNAKSIDAIKAAIGQVAKSQGLTLVFRENVAIYGSRDLGTDVKKIADKNAK
jgi:Skp family chaperone for outer membrane proteins